MSNDNNQHQHYAWLRTPAGQKWLDEGAISGPSLSGALPAELLARRFHDTYERLAPSFGYETRADTKAFDPSSPNGRLMIAVCGEVAAALPAEKPAAAAERGAVGQRLVTGAALYALAARLEPLPMPAPAEQVDAWWKHYAALVRAMLAAPPAQTTKPAQVDEVEIHCPSCGMNYRGHPASLIVNQSATPPAQAAQADEPSAREKRLRAAMERMDRDGPLPGMIAAFEQQFGQTWTDRDWRQEASIWSAAWRAALTQRPAAPLATDAGVKAVGVVFHDTLGILATQSRPAPVPDEQAGEWQWVPKVPTEEMLEAAHDSDRAYTLRVFGDVMTVMQGPWDHYVSMLAASPSRPAAAEKREPLPEGWTIEPKGEAIIVWRDGLGGYAATADDKNIASSILYHLAKELLGGSHPSTGGEA